MTFAAIQIDTRHAGASKLGVLAGWRLCRSFCRARSEAAMLSKRGLGYDAENVPKSKRLRANLADLFLSNEVSAARLQNIAQDAVEASAQHLGDLASAGSGGRFRGNCHRDLVRRLAKRSGWPKTYHANIRVFDTAKQTESVHMVPMWLPHELVDTLVRFGSLKPLLDQSGMCAETVDHMRRAAQELGADQLLGLGLWGDAMPCNWDRSESVHAFTLNFPGVSGEYAALRIPLVAMNKKFMLKGATIDDMCEVFRWSFVSLAAGVHPPCRHDGSAWTSTDSHRRRKAGTPIGVAGVLAEVRGDWAFYKEAFRFPQHNETAGCCFRCNVAPPGDRKHINRGA